MREIYLAAWDFVSWHWLTLACCAVLLEMLPLLLPSGNHAASSGGAVVATMVGYAMHRYFLFGESWAAWRTTGAGGRKSAARRFAVALAIMFVSVVGIVGVVCVKMASGGVGKDQMFGVAVVVGLPVYFLLLVIFGTALPAAAAGDRFGPWITLRRAGRTAPGIAGGLLAGPVLFSILIVVVSVFLGQRAGTMGGGIIAATSLAVCIRMLGFFTTALAVAVLCRAYLKVAPPGIIDQTPA